VSKKPLSLGRIQGLKGRGEQQHAKKKEATKKKERKLGRLDPNSEVFDLKPEFLKIKKGRPPHWGKKRVGWYERKGGALGTYTR